MKLNVPLLSLLSLALVGQAFAQAAPTRSLTLYSGRGRTFAEPIIQAFEKQTGVKVNVRYGTDAQLVAAIREEGTRSPADLYWGNSLGALGTLDADKKFLKLPAAVFRNVAPNYVPESQTWLPTTVRYRVLAYNTGKIKPEALPQSVFDLPKLSALKGRIGWTLTYSSFQDFLGGMIATRGEAVTRQWLQDMKALEPKDYATNNVGMLEAMRAGEIDVALTNHYYVQRVIRVGAPIETHFFRAGDIGNLGNATGAAVLKTSRNSVNATRFLNYLVGKDAQTFFLSVNFEYPVTGNIIYPSTLLPFSQVVERSPRVNPNTLPQYVEQAQRLLRELGLL